MNDRDQLAWETENAPKFAAAAFASAALAIVSVGILISASSGADNKREALLKVHDNGGLLLVGVVLQALSIAALIVVFYFFSRAITARRGSGLSMLWPLAYVAPFVILVGAILVQLDQNDIASTFVDHGPRTVARAKHLIDGVSAGPQTVAAVGLLLLAISFVNVGVNGIRAGLFSRFMGILAVVCGVFSLLGVLGGAGSGASFIQLFWTIALGFLLINRWPQGRGPAWSRVEAIPWPTVAQQREAAEAGGAPAPAPAAPEPAAPERTQAAQPAKRRKKKKRR